MTWVIVPFSKPDCAANVLENWAHQRATGWRLCIVENGPGVGSFATGDCDLLMHSEPGAARAKNAAISALRPHTDAVAIWDCDDYYGPGYLLELGDALRGHEIVGKRRHFVEYPDNLALYDVAGANRPTPWVLGCTLGFRPAALPPGPVYDESSKTLDDTAFCRAAAARGQSIQALSIWHFAYNRTRSDHLSALPEQLEKMAYPLCGTFDRNRAIVDGAHALEAA